MVTISLLGFYLFQMGDFVRGNYLMKNYEQELKELTNQNLALQGTANNITSLEKVEEKVREFNFVKVSKVKYIPISSDYLVKE